MDVSKTQFIKAQDGQIELDYDLDTGVVTLFTEDHDDDLTEVRIGADSEDFKRLHAFVNAVADRRKPARTRKNIGPQAQKVLKHLKENGSITARSALLDLDVASLPRRICDLKEAGHLIDSRIEVNKFTGQRYARYTLA